MRCKSHHCHISTVCGSALGFINYSTIIGDQVTFSVNHIFFYTYLNNPLILMLRPDNLYEFQSASGYVDTKGVETNMKFGYEWVKLFLGYTHTDAKQHYNGTVSDMPLTPGTG